MIRRSRRLFCPANTDVPDAAAAAGIPFIFASYGFGNPTHWDAKIEKFEDLLAL